MVLKIKLLDSLIWKKNSDFYSSSKKTITVSNKNTHLPAFEVCVFRVNLRNHLSYKKVIHIYLYTYLKGFQMKKKISNPVTKSADICKNAVLPEKSKLLEKIRHFEKISFSSESPLEKDAHRYE